MTTAMRDKIAALHSPTLLRKSALNIRGGAGVFKQVMSGMGYRTALEIGTYRGCAAAEIAQYCRRVVTIDLQRVHDADDNGPGRSNCVYEFISSLPKDQVEFIDIFALWTD